MIKEKSVVARYSDQLFFTGPTILFFMMSLGVPFLFGIYVTFMDVPNIYEAASGGMQFTGLDNYVTAFQDENFWKALLLTVKYTVSTIFFVNAIGFALAYLVTSGIKGQNFFRTSLFTPNLIGGLLLGYIWQFIFSKSFTVLADNGLNLPLIGKVNMEWIGYWLADEQKAFYALVVVTVWQSAGYMMILYVAGFMNVPKDIIEASTIDGAGSFQRLLRITLPMMVPSFVVTIFLTLKGSFMVYDVNLSLTEGGPFNSTIMASMHVVRLAFNDSGYGVGQTEAFILFAVVAIVTGIQVYFSKKLEVEA